MKFKTLTTAAAMLALLSLGAMASVIPYPNTGTGAPIPLAYTATASGDIIAYFFASDAGYSSKIGMLVNGVSTGVFGLPNHTSNYGDSIDLGHAKAGDSIVFELMVADIGHSWFSDPALNLDLTNHVYSVPFALSDNKPSEAIKIPVGTYIGFEDQPFGVTDFDYNDHQFVFTGLTSSVPEPATLALFGAGLVALGLLRRRHSN